MIRGTTFPAGHIVEPGHVGFDIKGDTWIGPFEPTNTPMARVNDLAAQLTQSRRAATSSLSTMLAALNGPSSFSTRPRIPSVLSRCLHHGAATRLPATGELFDDFDRRRRSRRKSYGHHASRRSPRDGAEGRERSRQTQRQHVAGRSRKARKPKWIS